MHPRSPARAGALLLLVTCVSCNQGLGLPAPEDGPVGSIAERPDGSGQLYLVDPHQGGRAEELRLVETFWGRLVDVFDLDARGAPRAEPLFHDFVIGEGVASDGVDYQVDTDPLTQVTRLVVLRTRGAPDDGRGTFDELLERASSSTAHVQPKNDDGTSPGPFPYVARNATLVLRFDDLLDDRPQAAGELASLVQARTGYPPQLGQDVRVSFDASHGGVLNGRFHSTRVLVDTTISSVEAATLPTPLAENLLGLPASLPGLPQPNVSIHVPSRADPASGQFHVLRSLGKAPLSTAGNGPIAQGSPTLDVVRALRSGNERDLSHGFLEDHDPPGVVGSWPATLDAVRQTPGGEPGVDLDLDLTFSSPCRRAPARGDLVQTGTHLLEVDSPGAPPQTNGQVRGVHARLVDASPPASLSDLLGNVSYSSIFSGALGLPGGCWITVVPAPASFPAQTIEPDAQIAVRFTEPMDPASLRPFDSLQLVSGASGTTPDATNTVVARVTASADLRDHVLTPALPLAHTAAGSEPYTLLASAGADGPTDLGGNPLSDPLPPIELHVDPLAASESSGGVVLRFDSPDEVDFGDPDPGGDEDVRGQVFHDLARGVLFPRSVTHASYAVDQSQPVPSLMTPLGVGVDAPLSRLGSKLQTLWRYVDMGWAVTDESKYDLDVEGLSWAPFQNVSADHFEGFEVLLAHSSRLPDEYLTPAGLLYPSSGLLPASPFADNVLSDPAGPQTIVHPRSLGYTIDPAQAFHAASGILLQPFPLNRGPGPEQTYTWRDTSVLARAGADGAGIPMKVEEPFGLYGSLGTGGLAGPGQVPSIGLPLLIELRCYPSNSAVGTNRFAVAIARAGQLFPSFRVHSTGGIDQSRRVHTVDPDTELTPLGGFDPTSSPPGARTRTHDPSLYLGQIDTVVRVSRAHTVWLDTGSTAPHFAAPVVEPDPSAQPTGTSIALDFRGASGFMGTGGAQFDAGSLDAYGETSSGLVAFTAAGPGWTSRLDSLDGSRYVQVRLSFLSDLASGRTAELDTLAIAFRR